MDDFEQIGSTCLAMARRIFPATERSISQSGRRLACCIGGDRRGAGSSLDAQKGDRQPHHRGVNIDSLREIQPWRWLDKYLTERRILGKHGDEYFGSKSGAFAVVLKNLVFSREYTMLDRINFFRGVFQSVRALYPELSRTDLLVEVNEVKTPVYFCLGRHDYEVPSVFAAQYCEVLQAPRKRLVWFESSAHLPNIEEKDKFNAFMINTVLPALT
jgi:pimeloyl-ACP methyl ester carboxylesterase